MQISEAPETVSPYLETIPPFTIERWRRRADIADWRHGAADDHRGRVGPGRALLWDWLKDRFVEIDGHEAELLARLRPERVVPSGALTEEQRARFAAHGLLLPEAEVCRVHNYKSVEIEINRHCNLRCQFCPVSETPLPKGYIDDDLFELVLQRVKEYGAKIISLNHYSEPTLARDLVGKLARIAELDLEVRLHTNATLLNEEKVAAMSHLGNLNVVVNLPTVDERQYEMVTGTKLFHRAIDNLDLLHRYGVPTQLSINVPREGGTEQTKRINERFAAKFGKSVAWTTDDRAGRLNTEGYTIPTRLRGPLGGCLLAIAQINVSHEGNAFLCCQDFNQDYQLGSLKTHSLRALAESERAIELRRWLFGYEVPPAHFICAKCSWTKPLVSGATLDIGNDAKRFSPTTKNPFAPELDDIAYVNASLRN